MTVAETFKEDEDPILAPLTLFLKLYIILKMK
jgi:hypothetical protein